MKIVAQEKLAGSQCRLTIEVSAQELAKYFKEACSKLALSLKIPGFRPGKAPLFIIEKEVGKERILKETLELALPETYFWAIKKTNLKPISTPQIKILEFSQGNLLKYEASVPLLPEVKVENWPELVKKSNIKPQEIKINEEDQEKVLAQLQRNLATHKEISRQAQKGDWAEIDFESFLDKTPLEGGISKNHPLVIGQGIFVPGFEEKLIGMAKGEEKEFDLIFPSNYHKKELSSKKVHFKVKLKDLKEVILPPLDDQLATKLGKKNLSELKEDIKKNLEEKSRFEAERKFEDDLLSYLIAQIRFEIPQVLIEEEEKHLLSDFENQLSKRGLTLEKYLSSLKKTKEEFQKEIEGEAERRIRVSLILAEIAKKEKIHLEDKEIDEEAKRRGAKITDDEKNYLRNVLINRKAIDLIKKAKI